MAFIHPPDLYGISSQSLDMTRLGRTINIRGIISFIIWPVFVAQIAAVASDTDERRTTSKFDLTLLISQKNRVLSTTIHYTNSEESMGLPG